MANIIEDISLVVAKGHRKKNFISQPFIFIITWFMCAIEIGCKAQIIKITWKMGKIHMLGRP
ncbi:hypothetical protein D8674_018261 [Pyrus ussuriensis x Pyrus communis]|uniref:Uncharacterized protein n=1 Tax=Pyrus ussuriensis x Pyrus communis TaxID=2448454 RepID=A0A5N5G490_9ROSA|nr:hypothetical protein D8674_018261 [Pyrus ussuriensis x Pyrus communis]